MSNIFVELSHRLNSAGLRAILSEDQAALLHGFAWVSGMSGSWIIREDEESLDHILGVLEDYGAQYRLGAPLDARWMRGGWSSHFEFTCDAYRRLIWSG